MANVTVPVPELKVPALLQFPKFVIVPVFALKFEPAPSVTPPLTVRVLPLAVYVAVAPLLRKLPRTVIGPPPATKVAPLVIDPLTRRLPAAPVKLPPALVRFPVTRVAPELLTNVPLFTKLPAMPMLSVPAKNDALALFVKFRPTDRPVVLLGALKEAPAIFSKSLPMIKGPAPALNVPRFVKSPVALAR